MTLVQALVALLGDAVGGRGAEASCRLALERREADRLAVEALARRVAARAPAPAAPLRRSA